MADRKRVKSNSCRKRMRKKETGNLAKSCQIQSMPLFSLRNQSRLTGQASRCRPVNGTVAGSNRKS